MTSCYLSFIFHRYPSTYPFISFLIHCYTDIYLPGYSFWFSAFSACSTLQLDWTFSCMSCIDGVTRPQGAATAGPRASSGAGSGPVAAETSAPVVCGAGTGYRRRRSRSWSKRREKQQSGNQSHGDSSSSKTERCQLLNLAPLDQIIASHHGSYHQHWISMKWNLFD